MSSRCATPASSPQCGATLVLALLLLGVLALLGVSALQSAALDLTMSGNEQFRARALLAAEAGIAQAVIELRGTAPGDVPAARRAQSLDGMSGDEWSSAVGLVGDDPTTLAASGGARRGQHYTIESSGRSLRGASVALTAGVLVVRDAGGATLAVTPLYWKRRDVE
jgi:hypothetical protein